MLLSITQRYKMSFILIMFEFDGVYPFATNWFDMSGAYNNVPNMVFLQCNWVFPALLVANNHVLQLGNMCQVL